MKIIQEWQWPVPVITKSTILNWLKKGNLIQRIQVEFKGYKWNADQFTDGMCNPYYWILYAKLENSNNFNHTWNIFVSCLYFDCNFEHHIQNSKCDIWISKAFQASLCESLVVVVITSNLDAIMLWILLAVTTSHDITIYHIKQCYDNWLLTTIMTGWPLLLLCS